MPAPRPAALALCALLASTCGPSGGGDLGIAVDAGDAGARDGSAPDLAGRDLALPPSGDLAFVPRDLQPCPPDGDGDHVPLCAGDCDDEDGAVHPGAAEACNAKDDDCDGRIDEGFDTDGDGWTTCAGDCDDTSRAVHPAALPRCDGMDSNCNGKPDQSEDVDSDGYAACNDCDDTQALVNPGAFEVPGDQTDNDCDGAVDEMAPGCDLNLAFRSQDAADYARAMELCPDPFLVSTSFAAVPDDRARGIAPDYGLYQTKAGRSFVVLSSGVAAAPGQPDFRAPQDGTDFGNLSGDPVPGCTTCGTVSPTVRDVVELRVALKVPTNAKSFSFDFNFLSAEYPEWVGSEYNDKFLAMLDSKGYAGNVSFDGKGRPIEINNAFFTITRAQDLAGTGYDAFDPMRGRPVGGATGWLTTTSPVEPGESITLRFLIMDQGDGILDSAVILDRFRWSLEPASGGPSTVRTM